MTTSLPLAVALAHLAVVALHDAAHLALGIGSSPLPSLYVILVIHLMPLVGVCFLLRGAPRPGLGWLALGLTGSLVYATYAHFFSASPEHLAHEGSGAWASLFAVTAWLISALDLLGVAFVLRSARQALLPRGARVVLVDGTCVFCTRLVSQILRHDAHGVYYFAHLQSDYARAALARHGADPSDIDGVYLLTGVGTPAEELLVDGSAGRAIWPSLLVLATPLLLVPAPLLDPFYQGFSRIRYRLFGRYDTCRVPNADERKRFLSAPAAS